TIWSRTVCMTVPAGAPFAPPAFCSQSRNAFRSSMLMAPVPERHVESDGEHTFWMTIWTHPPWCAAAPVTSDSMFASDIGCPDGAAYARVANQSAGGTDSAYVGPAGDRPPARLAFP